MTTVPDYFKGFGVDKPENWASPKLVEYKRKKTNPHDVIVKTIACGLCGSDLHCARGNWGPLNRNDLVVGHEIVGTVIAIGDEVTTISVGQRVGIGAASSACRKNCKRCQNDNHVRCKGGVGTYNSPDSKADGYVTQGGYASHAIADEEFVFPIPEELTSEEAAPLMCAGLTVFSPLVRNLGYDLTGKTVGIIGIGGLGHLAIQFANALGAKVVVFSRSDSKKEDALKMGAHEFIATSKDKEWAARYQDQFDLILSCASGVDLELAPFFSALDIDRKFVTVGMPSLSENFVIPGVAFVVSGAQFASSALGSKKEAIKMLEVAATKGVRPWIQTIQLGEEGCHTALTNVDKGHVRYRYVFTGFDKAFA